MRYLLLFYIVVMIQSCAHQNRQTRMVSQVENDLIKGSSLIKYSWTQLVDKSQVSFRVITSDSVCPSIAINSELYPMQVRQIPNGLTPNLVCEFRTEKNVETANIGPIKFPIVSKELTDIVAYGDTGCRIKNLVIQNCRDPKEWPFANINQGAATLKPQLAIHLGDYSYRDMECPVSDERCSDLAGGKNWKSWEQDVFIPMGPLLKTSPFIFVRGNHESCGSFGELWFTFFGPEAAENSNTKCISKSETYYHDFGQHRFINIDSADGKSLPEELGKPEHFDETKTVWLLSHRPFLAAHKDVSNSMTTEMLRVMKPKSVQQVLAGHTHVGSFINFTDGRPAELVLGNGGVYIDPFVQAHKSDSKSQAYSARKYGFAHFKKVDSENWAVKMLDYKLKTLFDCKMKSVPQEPSNINCSN